MAGRDSGFQMGQEHRTKISNSKILSRLMACAEGELELTKTQASVGIALLKKVMPDLQSTQHSGDPDNPVAMITELRRTIIDAKPGNTNSSGVPPAA